MSARLTWAGAFVRPDWLSSDGLTRLSQRITDTAGYRTGKVTTAQRLAWLVSSLAIPGMGLILAGRRRQGGWILAGYVASLAASILFMSSGWMLFYAIMLGLHGYSIVACLAIRAEIFRLRMAILSGLAAAVFLQFYVYALAAWLVTGMVHFDQLEGIHENRLFKNGDVVMVQGRWLAPDGYRRGDLVSYAIPASGGRGWVSREGSSIDRILAVPGDHVVYKDGLLLVNGKPPSQLDGEPARPFALLNCDRVLQEGTYLIYPAMARLTLLGANASQMHAEMATRVSWIPIDDIRGQVLMIINPLGRLRRL